MKIVLLLIFLTSNTIMAKTGQQLTLYFIPSPSGMDWSSPANLAWSALKNRLSFKSRFMGHVFAEVQCEEDYQLAGMVGKRFDYLHQLLVEGRGLGILYHSFEGRLEAKEEIAAELNELKEEGKRLNFVSFKINKNQCSRLLTYLKEYREKNFGRFYGLSNRPLHGEGSGCSAFGASFLEVAGIGDGDLRQSWGHTVKIPLKYAGPPLSTEKVSLFSLMLNAGSWAKDHEPHQELSFWDPDKMYQWVNNKLESSAGGEFEVQNFGKARGVVFDKTHLEIPVGEIWQKNP
jgi:hypothetical protein